MALMRSLFLSAERGEVLLGMVWYGMVWYGEITVPLSAQCGEVLLGQSVHPHQVDVGILLPLELLHN